MPRRTRREFLRDSTAVAVGAAAITAIDTTSSTAQAAEGEPFRSRWDSCPDRAWLGPEYWANPLQDWRLADGRIECLNAASDRNVHLLTRQLGENNNGFRMTVRVGRIGGGPLLGGKGSVGFRIAQGPLHEYRNSLIFGTGFEAGLTSDGRLFLGDMRHSSQIPADRIPAETESVELRLEVLPGQNNRSVSIDAYNVQTGRSYWGFARNDVTQRLVGNLVLVANFGGQAPGRANQQKAAPNGLGNGRFWFSDWHVAGHALAAHEDRIFGPILFSQYTLHGGILKLTAQMPPIGAKDSQMVRLQIDDSGQWKTLAEERIHPQARTAMFRIEQWDDRKDVPYRLAYSMASTEGKQEEHFWTGTVRRDPADPPVLTVADISCNIHAAFPNDGYVAQMAKLNPDLLAFVGDQFYESSGGYGVQRTPLEPAILDYLRKWYLHGWTWRDLTRDRPSVSLPDDHDVYQGNLWGEDGAPKQGTQEMGGYDMHPDWVNVVHRTQASHHPDPYDPTPVKQHISVYYGPLTYGRVSFAIVADRQFKTGPEGVVPPTGGRGDHVTDPNFDPKTADVPGAELLGERQMRFLRDWAADWRGADMKAVISQTVFTAMATTHGGQRERLRADYDANGWPQTPRNDALRELRKCFAVHLAGDQHLPALVHYGIDEHRDAAVAFAGPAINVGYPRWWEPEEPGKNRKPGAPEITGDFLDHFGNPMTVLAVANGAIQPRGTVLEMMRQKASGLGIVRFDKSQRTITFECWPYLADVTAAGTQFPGWPVTVNQLDNYARKAATELPTLMIEGVENPVVQIVSESDGELVYTLRIRGRQFQPKVFAAGMYTVRVSEPESGRSKETKGIEATVENRKQLQIQV